MADLGLLAGLGEMLKQGVGAYQDQTKFIQDQALKKRQLALQEQAAAAGMYEKGIETTPGGGFKDSLLPEPEQKLYKSFLGQALPGVELPDGGITRRGSGVIEKMGAAGLGMQGQQARTQQAGRDLEYKLMEHERNKQKDLANAKNQEEVNKINRDYKKAELLLKGISSDETGEPAFTKLTPTALAQLNKTNADLGLPQLGEDTTSGDLLTIQKIQQLSAAKKAKEEAEKRAAGAQETTDLTKGVQVGPDGKKQFIGVSKDKRASFDANQKKLGLPPLSEDATEGDFLVLDKAQKAALTMRAQDISKDKVRATTKNTDIARANLDLRKRGLDLREDMMGMRTSAIWDKDPILKPLLLSKYTVSRGLHTLEHPPMGIITNQLLHESGAEIAKALTGAAAVAQSTIEHQTYTSLASNVAAMTQKITGAPKDVGSKKMVEYLKATMKRLDEGFTKSINEQASRLGEGQTFKSPQLNQIYLKKMNAYQNLEQSGKPQGMIGGPQQGLIQAPQAPQSVKIHVKNPKTGKEFYIPASRLQEAAKDGFEVVK